jgi:DNA-binding GntR family transcriptional regulator
MRKPNRSRSARFSHSVTGQATHAMAVRDALEAEICSGKLAPGTPIDEAALAKRFKMSRTPVREAVLKLLEAGLIEKKSRKRSEVAGLDLPRLIHMFETLADLEGLSALYCARRITEPERKALAKNHEQAAVALRAGDETEYARLGAQFHRLILEASHNEVLIELAGKLAARLVPYRRLQLRVPGRFDANQRDHEAILVALFAGDTGRAQELMRSHAAIQGDMLADYIAHAKDVSAPARATPLRIVAAARGR